jgi:hypothetical protein
MLPLEENNSKHSQIDQRLCSGNSNYILGFISYVTGEETANNCSSLHP